MPNTVSEQSCNRNAESILYEYANALSARECRKLKCPNNTIAVIRSQITSTDA